MMWKYIFGGLGALSLLILGVVVYILVSVSSGLPQDLSSITEYEPAKVSKVFDRNNKLVGEFFEEKRELIKLESLQKFTPQAFLAAEDADFYNHSGINLSAIARAFWANLKAGKKVQGGSTITQQVAKQLLLSTEKSYKRKLKEAFLARKIENQLSKQQILNLYLNQIFFGQASYGIETAAQTYFQKKSSELTLAESAMLAGLPKAPTRFSPVRNPKRSKQRQIYVLDRMLSEGYITAEAAEEAKAQPLKVFYRTNSIEEAPYYLDTVKNQLAEKLEPGVIDQKGLQIHTGLDLEYQKHAQRALKKGLQDLDKRQGYRGPLEKVAASDIESTLEKITKARNLKVKMFVTITADGEYLSETQEVENPFTPSEVTKALVTHVDDRNKWVLVESPRGLGKIKFSTMRWARKPNPDLFYDAVKIKRPSQALAKGDLILVKVKDSEDFNTSFKKTTLKSKSLKHLFELEQEPLAQGALISFDLKTSEIVAMVGGYDYIKSKFNRSYQAARQTGSAFKPIVYASALDKGYHPNSEILDIPVVFKERVSSKKSGTGQSEVLKYKPSNHSKGFSGDILFRTALVKSLNIPTIQITDDVGVSWILNYAQRLGVHSKLNPDLTLALGSSSISLYELTKVYAHFGRLGKKISPLLLKKVIDPKEDNELLANYSLDQFFEKEIGKKDEKWSNVVLKEKAFGELSRKFVFSNQNQLISPQTAFVMTDILKGVISDSGGTAGRARSLGRPLAGKTGTTDGYFDAWFMGYSPQIVTGVWVGFDQEQSLGRGEVGGRSALPIWIDYMTQVHKKLPMTGFKVPGGISFANINTKNGKLAGPSSTHSLRQAFRAGEVPTERSSEADSLEDQSFFKDDLSG